MMEGNVNRERKIAERLGQMPSKYRATYRRAVQGKSLRACVNAQCLECCGWQSVEVTLCTDLGCPLYAVRPYQHRSGSGRDGHFTAPESANRQAEGQQTGESVGCKGTERQWFEP